MPRLFEVPDGPVRTLGCNNQLVQPATLGTKRSSDAELFLSPFQVKLRTGEARLNELLNRRVQLRSGVTHCMSLFGTSLFAKIPLQFNAQRTFRIQA
jgi:hypothetical protein